MEPSQLVVAKKLWNIVRIVFFMVGKGLSKSKILVDLHLMLKRGKLTGKAIVENFLSNKGLSSSFSWMMDNEIKNYWNIHIKRKLINYGLDPHTQRPINKSTIAATTTSMNASQLDFRNGFPLTLPVTQINLMKPQTKFIVEDPIGGGREGWKTWMGKRLRWGRDNGSGEGFNRVCEKYK